MTAAEGNKLIAEFMGAESEYFEAQMSTIGKSKVPSGRIYFSNRSPDNMHLCLLEDLKYHSSWDWLMLVVEKIQSIDITPAPNYKGYRIEIVVQGYVKIEGFPMPPIFTNVSIEGGLINAVWKAVTLFITWYNTSKKIK